MLETYHPLVFIRHGRTQWNEQGRYQGSSDTKLSSAGYKDAEENGTLLQQLFDNEILDPIRTKVVTSPQHRARETADIIRKTNKHLSPPLSDNSFRELSLGRWEGLTSSEVKERYYEERKSRKTDRWQFKPKGGESMAERAPEIAAALVKINSPTVIVTHSMVLCVIAHIIAGKTMHEITAMDFPHRGLLIWDGEELGTFNAKPA